MGTMIRARWREIRRFVVRIYCIDFINCNTGDERLKALPFTTVEDHMYRVYHQSKPVYVRLTLRWGRVDIVCFICVH